MITHGSLFSGIGGFDLAAEWLGWENKFHCEINEFGQKILSYYWPKAESYEDITKTEFTIWRGRIDVLSGGFPCQPYSVAGKRKGKEDDRHLWPEMLRAIREIQPRFVVGENVRGLVNWNGGLVFDEVQSELEAEGYEVIPFILPAAGVGAPHKRERVWFVAYRSNSRIEGLRERTDKTNKDGTLTHSNNGLRQEYRLRPRREVLENWSNRTGVITNAKSESSWRQLFERQGERKFGRSNCSITSNSHNKGLEGCKNKGEVTRKGQESNEQPSGRILTNWQDFPTQSPVCGGNDGIPSELHGITIPKWRNESIKGFGNAIVPQVVYPIFKVINEQIQNETNS